MCDHPECEKAFQEEKGLQRAIKATTGLVLVVGKRLTKLLPALERLRKFPPHHVSGLSHATMLLGTMPLDSVKRWHQFLKDSAAIVREALEGPQAEAIVEALRADTEEALKGMGGRGEDEDGMPDEMPDQLKKLLREMKATVRRAGGEMRDEDED